MDETPSPNSLLETAVFLSAIPIAAEHREATLAALQVLLAQARLLMEFPLDAELPAAARYRP